MKRGGRSRVQPGSVRVNEEVAKALKVELTDHHALDTAVSKWVTAAWETEFGKALAAESDARYQEEKARLNTKRANVDQELADLEATRKGAE